MAMLAHGGWILEGLFAGVVLIGICVAWMVTASDRPRPYFVGLLIGLGLLGLLGAFSFIYAVTGIADQFGFASGEITLRAQFYGPFLIAAVIIGLSGRLRRK